MIYVPAAVTVAATLALSTPASAQQANNAAVERGKYLVRITGCHDCHSPKVQGMTPNLDLALSGRPASTQLPTETKTEVHASPDLTAWTGPWGVSVASNLTPAGLRSVRAALLALERTVWLRIEMQHAFSNEPMMVQRLEIPPW